MKKLILPALLSCLLCGTAAAQQVIHVAPNGSDAPERGIAGQPLATLQYAYDMACTRTGTDTLYIRMAPGRYELDKTLRLSRSPQRPVVIEGDAAGGTVLSGGIRLPKWEKTERGWWKTHIDETERYGLRVEQLYVGGQRAVRAKSPDKGWFFVQEVKEWIPYRGKDRSPEYAVQRYRLQPEDTRSLSWSDADEIRNVMVMFFHKWDNTRRYLDKAVPDSGYLCTSGTGMKPWNPVGKGSRCILENYEDALSVPGEWYLKPDGDLLYIPREGETPDKAVAYAPVLPTLVRIEGQPTAPVENVTFRRLCFEHAAYVMPNWGVDPAQAASTIGAAIHADHARNIHFDGCTVQHTGNYAFWLGRNCHDCSVKHSFLYDLGAGGVKIGENTTPPVNEVCHHITVENNIIRKAGRVSPSAVGVLVMNAHDNRVVHNDISDLFYTGISVGWVWGYAPSYSYNNEVGYNHIHHLGWGELSDMGAIYLLGTSPGTRVHHNVIHDIYSYDYGGWGLYTDEGSSEIVLEDNLVYACKSGAFHQHYGRDNIVRNNIFAFSQYYQLQFSRVENHRSFTFCNNIVLADCGVLLQGAWDRARIDMQKNLYWDLRTDEPRFLNRTFEEWRKTKDKDAVLADPLFVAPQQGDFHFKSHRNIRKIGFKPFDYARAGVYGSTQWQQLAQFPQADDERFRQIVTGREKQASRYYLR